MQNHFVCHSALTVDVITAAELEVDQLPDHQLSDILHQSSSLLVDC